MQIEHKIRINNKHLNYNGSIWVINNCDKLHNIFNGRIQYSIDSTMNNDKLLQIRNELLKLGFNESFKTQYLFSFQLGKGKLFASMQQCTTIKTSTSLSNVLKEMGLPITEFNLDWLRKRNEKITEECKLQIYYYFPKSDNDYQSIYFREQIEKLLDKLKEKNIPYMISQKISNFIYYYLFFGDSVYTKKEMDDFLNMVYFFEKQDELEFKDNKFNRFSFFYGYRLPNGRCKCCGKIINNNIYHCSIECREKENNRYLAIQINNSEECPLCTRKVVDEALEIKEKLDVELPGVLVAHHISYEPEETIKICPSCHNIIHRTDKYLNLKPNQKEIRDYYNEKENKKNKIVLCKYGCGRKTKSLSGVCPKCKKKYAPFENRCRFD